MPTEMFVAPGRDTHTMFSANLELVRSIFAAAWERGDFTTAADWADPELQFVVVGGPEPSSRKGLAGIGPGSEEFLSLWDNFRVKAEEYRELDDERVLVLTLATGRGRSSGVQIDQRRASLFHVRDGKLTRIVVYWERERAFADLGLSG
jgi:ketosteroid isomerase-like protein